ncbi:MAG: ribonuclease HII [Candidatus Omnitrophica bacterium]|nr:ribonuclease HII [Candidatus Omnitrophota bacterium]
MLYYERKFRKIGYNLIVGVDEAGRGPLAGPVSAAAVALKTVRFKNRIDDSKKLSPIQRERAFGEIINKSVFGIGIISERVIDRVNIAVATRMAMERAISRLIAKLKSADDRRNIHILVDGCVKLDIDLPFTSIIKGDAKSKSIACASILAKVIRDRIMSSYDKIYPQYGFLKHKGYPTREHRQALKKFGPSLIHRTSFYGV